MPIIDIYSKRQKKFRGETSDVYQYDRLPEQLRVQIVHIMYDVLGNREQYLQNRHVKEVYDFITDTLCREYGLFRLPAIHPVSLNKMMDLEHFFLQVEEIEKALDIIELSFRSVDIGARDQSYSHISPEAADRAIQELNGRFKEHSVGYYYENRKIICVDDEFIHSEVVQPALGILNREEYAVARQEFLQAHEHYRAGRTKEALNECLKSLESVMKSICDRRGIGDYDPRGGCEQADRNLLRQRDRPVSSGNLISLL